MRQQRYIGGAQPDGCPTDTNPLEEITVHPPEFPRPRHGGHDHDQPKIVMGSLADADVVPIRPGMIRHHAHDDHGLSWGDVFSAVLMALVVWTVLVTVAVLIGAYVTSDRSPEDSQPVTGSSQQWL